MNRELKSELLEIYRSALQPPFTGGFRAWCEANIDLPAAYAIPGRLDLSLSPYLHAPAAAVDDPRIMQINLSAATQTGKTLLAECFIPYEIINCPGPTFRIFHSKEASDLFAESRLIPLLKNCEPIKPLLRYDRFSTKKAGITLPHVSVTMGSSNTSLQHGMSVKYLLADELHAWDTGQFAKFLARTTAFSGRRKIICSSQPGRVGSEWDNICNKGRIYEWTWLCPECHKRQFYSWSKERPDGSFAGINWDSILLPDGETNIAESSETARLECEFCKHEVHDTPSERLYLNQTGDYMLTKSDGDPSIVTYNWPGYVNVNLAFRDFVSAYMIARKMKIATGLDEQMEIFVEQMLGRTYKKEAQIELSKILIESYDKDNLDTGWVNILGVDFQRTGKIKYYVVRAWNKNGNESRRLAFGIARTWDEIEALRVKYKVMEPCVHVDSGDGETVSEVYQECLRHGRAVKLSTGLQYISWAPTKGDGQKSSYKHPDGITRLYAPVSPQDAQFPADHKLKGIPAPLVLFSNYSLKTILANLRDNRMDGIKWLVDAPDEEYDKQLYSEGLVDVVDKKSGAITKRWTNPRGVDNHYLDCEVLCLLGALRANAFSATKINEDDIRKIIASAQKPAPVV